MSHFFSPHVSPLRSAQATWRKKSALKPNRHQRGKTRQCVPTHAREVLTVQVTVPDALHVLRVDEVVASLPHNIYRGQIHVITDPTRTIDWNSEGEKIQKLWDVLETNLLAIFIIPGYLRGFGTLRENSLYIRLFLWWITFSKLENVLDQAIVFK